MNPSTRMRMCFGKKTYPTQTKAISAAIGSSRTFGKPMRPYRCPVCKKWHLTSDIGESND